MCSPERSMSVVRCSVFLLECLRHIVDSCVWGLNRAICMTRDYHHVSWFGGVFGLGCVCVVSVFLYLRELGSSGRSFLGWTKWWFRVRCRGLLRELVEVA